MHRVTYVRNGVKYSAVIRAIGRNAIEIACLRRGIVKREIVKIESISDTRPK